ncbi:MAG TPA: hypothetical protein VI451_18485 [Anaerolineales bacterium]|nr:hypothetical protein [Anaerolineales bacterium]
MKNRRLFIPFILLTLLFLTACTLDPNDQFIQGGWSFANETGDYLSGKTHVYHVWQFSNGTFFVQQEIAMGNPLVSEGRYRILESEEDLLILELFNVEGNYIISDPYELRVEIDRENDTARIQRALFDRVYP